MIMQILAAAVVVQNGARKLWGRRYVLALIVFMYFYFSSLEWNVRSY